MTGQGLGAGNGLSLFVEELCHRLEGGARGEAVAVPVEAVRAPRFD